MIKTYECKREILIITSNLSSENYCLVVMLTIKLHIKNFPVADDEI